MNKTKTFPVRAKIISIVLLSVVVLSLSVYIIANQVLLKSYVSIENQEMVKNVERVNDAINNNIFQLDVKLKDWSSWDDTYQYVVDKNSEYVKSNLGDRSLANVRINTMVFNDNTGHVVFKKVVDFDTAKELSSESIGKYVESHDKIKSHNSATSSVSGLITLPEGVMLVSSRPILTSDSEGPIHGTLVFGRFFNTQLTDQLSDLTHLTVNTYDYKKTSLPEDVLLAKKQLSLNGGVFINPMSKDTTAGYSILSDIYGEPIMILKVESPRVIYVQGQKTFNLLLVLSAVVILVFGALVIFLMEKFIISRIVKLSREVTKVGESHDLSSRVSEDKNDEIGKLSHTINQMLSDLVVSQEKEIIAVSAEKDAILKLKEHAEEIEKMNKMMVDRELKMVELKKEIEKIKSSE